MNDISNEVEKRRVELDKREREIEEFMKTDDYKDHNQFVSNELSKILIVLFILIVIMKVFTSA